MGEKYLSLLSNVIIITPVRGLLCYGLYISVNFVFIDLGFVLCFMASH